MSNPNLFDIAAVPLPPRKRKERLDLSKWKKANRVSTYHSRHMKPSEDPWSAWITPEGKEPFLWMTGNCDSLAMDDQLTYGKTEREACERLVQPNKLTPLP